MNTLFEIKLNQQELAKRMTVLEVEKPSMEPGAQESAILDAPPMLRIEEFGNFDGDLDEKRFRTLVSRINIFGSTFVSSTVSTFFIIAIYIF